MIQYINKSALVVAIKKEIKDIYAGREYVGIPSWEEREIDGLEKAIEILDTIEVKEVDLEKEMDKEWNKCEPIDEGMGLEIASIKHEQFDNIAKHFFELGLKTKGE